jgi:exopolyphosphatase / guanosine-5'-triphosphate,3'-diphosphate pyrophosphatase
MNQILSAIDIGSNAIRMIVVENSGTQPKILKKYRAPVRIGADVFQDQLISQKTLELAIDTFVEFARLLKEHRVTKYRAVATSAVREAKNQNDFIEVIYKKTNLKIESINGLEEAKLIHTAVANELDLNKKKTILIDIGGGSVEVTFSENSQIVKTHSFSMGTVRLLQNLKARKLGESDLKSIIGEYLQPLITYIESYPSYHSLDFAIGTGGNLECMSVLKKKLLRQTPSNILTLDELVALSEKLAKISMKARVLELDLKPDRADVILPALLVVKAVLRHAGVSKILIPGVGLRDGLIQSLLKPTAL